MINVDKDHVLDLMLAEAYSEKHQAEAKIEFFKNSYKKDLVEFEKDINEKEESFTHFNDLIEWKGYINYLKEIESRIKDIKEGNVKVA